MIYKIVNWIHVLRQKYHIWRKRKSILSVNPVLKKVKIENPLLEKFKDRWSPFGRPSVDWLKIYIGVNGNNDYNYIPEIYYYTDIEPRLNNKIYTLAYADKNFYLAHIRARLLQ